MHYQDQDEEVEREAGSSLVYGVCWLAIGLSASCGILCFWSLAHGLLS